MSNAICPMPLAEIIRDVTGRKEETNPVKKLYREAFKADIGRWISACAVIGLSAGLLSKHPGQEMLAASAFNLAVASLHFFMLKVPVRPSGSTDPRPPIWYMIILAASTVLWLAAFIVIFVFRNPSQHNDSGIEKRRAGFLDDVGTGTVAMVENLSIACGCFGICAFLFCVYQWSVVHRLLTTRFKKSEMREAYRKKNKTGTEKHEKNGTEV
ncbi:hypothetical protein CEP54_006086 [Fusarium duplospermum]|uniref:MARVEL domain-containing protein n=1 Tax=Fusarium duplospermum TaxID=1325734 RepID=A0A428Q8W3_9HYPO|nr:hypothetical protein CEP54_006086 [Fusarium duplospermum]